MIRVENETVETEGKVVDLLMEAALALVEVIERVAIDDNTYASACMYAVNKTAIEVLKNRYDIDINKETILFGLKGGFNDSDH